MQERLHKKGEKHSLVLCVCFLQHEQKELAVDIEEKCLFVIVLCRQRSVFGVVVVLVFAVIIVVALSRSVL